MNMIKLTQSLKSLRLSGMADVLETRIIQAQSESLAPADFLAALVNDELTRRADRLLARRIKAAEFRDKDKTLASFDFAFNKTDKRPIFELATGHWLGRCEDALFLGAPGTGKSHVAQALGLAVIQQGHRVLYRETHKLLEDIADATLDGTRKERMLVLTTVPLLIIDDLGMRKLAANAAEELLEVVMRRYERASTIITSNRPIEDWGKMLGDTTAVTALLDRMMHHGHVIKFGPRSYRTAKRTIALREQQLLR